MYIIFAFWGIKTVADSPGGAYEDPALRMRTTMKWRRPSLKDGRFWVS
jgi:hypothetical protein